MAKTPMRSPKSATATKPAPAPITTDPKATEIERLKAARKDAILRTDAAEASRLTERLAHLGVKVG
jgi:hypothetical protein